MEHDFDLEAINAERRRKGLPPLTREQARAAIRERAEMITRERPGTDPDNGFNVTHFLIGYLTGIPMPSTAGIMGAMMHPTSPAPAADIPAPSPAPAYEPPAPSSPSAAESYSPSPSPSFEPSTPMSTESFSGGGGGPSPGGGSPGE